MPLTSASNRRPWRLVLLTVGVLAVVTLTSRRADSPGKVSWRSGSAQDVIEPFAELPSEYPLELTLELTRPAFVYVASHDLVRGTIAWFPSTQLRSDVPVNPLPVGTHRLPGFHDGVRLHWHTGDEVGAVTVAVVVSDHPLGDLAAALGRCMQMGNAAFPKQAKLGTYAPASGMGSTPSRSTPADPILVASRDLQDPEHDGALTELPGHDGVWAKVLRVRTSTATPVDDSDTLNARIRESIGPLGGSLPAPPNDGAGPVGAPPAGR